MTMNDPIKAALSPKPSAEGAPFVDEVRRIMQETGCDEASAKARILREATEGAVEITSDWKVKPSAEGTEPPKGLGICGRIAGCSHEGWNKPHVRNDACWNWQEFRPAPSGETRGTCELCTHTLEDNNHGFDQNDAEMDGDRLVHYGRCTYCKICNPRKPVAPEAVGTKEPTSWRTEMLGDDAPGEAVGRAKRCGKCDGTGRSISTADMSSPMCPNCLGTGEEAVGRETREPTKSNVTTFSAATEKCATRIWDMYLKGSGLDVDMAFADLCREINDAMQSELSTLTALRELDKEAFEMLNTSETEGMRLVAELRATIESRDKELKEIRALLENREGIDGQSS